MHFVERAQIGRHERQRLAVAREGDARVDEALGLALEAFEAALQLHAGERGAAQGTAFWCVGERHDGAGDQLVEQGLGVG